MGASVIAFDVLFLEPSRFGPEDDARLAEAAARAGNVIFGHKLTHIVDQQFRTSALDKPVPPLAEAAMRSEEHTSELQSRENLVCRLLLEKRKDLMSPDDTGKITEN